MYVLHAMAPEWERLAYGSTHLTIYMPDLESVRIPVCDLQVQRAIADYLDAETARIDALIEKKRRMVELLEERLGSAIRWRLVTLDSGRLPLKREWTVTDCKHRTPDYLDEGIPIVSPGDATPGRLDLSRAHRFVSEREYADLAEGPRLPHRGDVVYSRNASIGIASYVDTDERFCMGQDVCLISSKDQNQLYLTYVLNTLGADLLDEAKIGSTFSRINVAQIVDLMLPIPAPDEQRTLAEEFDAMSIRTARLVESLKFQIVLLAERRRAVITAAVTGQVDIPGLAA
jgi:type I restriction enzyme S subunit